jgi:hypothetical protein
LISRLDNHRSVPTKDWTNAVGEPPSIVEVLMLDSLKLVNREAPLKRFTDQITN